MTIRHGGGNTVGDQAHAAHAEGGPCAKAARGNLQILRVVLAVLRDDAGHTIQRLGQIDLRFVFADDAGIDAINRHRQIEAVLRDARAGDDQGWNAGWRHRRHLRLCLCLCHCAVQERQGGQHNAAAPNKRHHFRLAR